MSMPALASIGDHGVLNTPMSKVLSDIWIDRDLSWLNFNKRVLAEALDERTPLLEKAKFLAIFTSNLDEFFMKRVSVLRHGLPSDNPRCYRNYGRSCSLCFVSKPTVIAKPWFPERFKKMLPPNLQDLSLEAGESSAVTLGKRHGVLLRRGTN
jgi:polyphosphate kinase